MTRTTIFSVDGIYLSARAIRGHFISGLGHQGSGRFIWSPGHHSGVSTISLTKLTLPLADFGSGSFVGWVLGHEHFTWILGPFSARRCGDGVHIFLCRVVVRGPRTLLMVGGLMDYGLKRAAHLSPTGLFRRRTSKATKPMHCKASFLPCKFGNFKVRPKKKYCKQC